MSQPFSDPRPTLMTLPAEIQLKILGYVMASEAPVDLQEFVELGGELQNIRETSREAWSWESDGEAEPVVLEERILSTKASQSSAAWALSGPCNSFFTELHPSQKEHYLDWLLINSTCRRFRELGKVVFFSEKCFIIKPCFLKVLSQAAARNLSTADADTALAQIRHVIAPLTFDSSTARDFRILARYHALRCIKILSIKHRKYAAIIRSTGRPAVEDLAAVDRIPSPLELLDFLRYFGLQVDRLRVDLINDDDKDILECLASEVYPGLRRSAAREARRWKGWGSGRRDGAIWSNAIHHSSSPSPFIWELMAPQLGELVSIWRGNLERLLHESDW